MTTVFFYARLWRRLGVLTDLEFYELRYSGAPATWVRGFRAIYLGLFFNTVIMAAVNLAAAKIANVLVGRVTSGLLMVLAGSFTLVLHTAQGSFNLLLSVGAGTGLLYLLRWFWRRINAWSEIAAMASSFILATTLFVAERRGVSIPSHVSLLATIAITTAVWLATAYLTRPTDEETLRRFCLLAPPAGPGWARVRAHAGAETSPDNLSGAFVCWFAGVALVYGALFGAGHLLFGHTTAGAIGVVAAIGGSVVLTRQLPRLWAV